VSSVTTEGSKIVIHTDGASLSEAIVTGDLHETKPRTLASSRAEASTQIT
jgi:hypothetical protein